MTLGDLTAMHLQKAVTASKTPSEFAHVRLIEGKVSLLVRVVSSLLALFVRSKQQVPIEIVICRTNQVVRSTVCVVRSLEERV
jgi:hypothetical protein